MYIYIYKYIYGLVGNSYDYIMSLRVCAIKLRTCVNPSKSNSSKTWQLSGCIYERYLIGCIKIVDEIQYGVCIEG